MPSADRKTTTCSGYLRQVNIPRRSIYLVKGNIKTRWTLVLSATPCEALPPQPASWRHPILMDSLPENWAVSGCVHFLKSMYNHRDYSPPAKRSETMPRALPTSAKGVG